jgi:hypothetical protein
MIHKTNDKLRFGAGLEEQETVLVGELLGLFERHVSLTFQVALVTDQVDHRVRMGEAARVRQPRAEVIVGAAARDVVDHEGARRASIVAARHRPESLLARRVPDLQLDLLARHLDDARAELDSDRVRTVRHNLNKNKQKKKEKKKRDPSRISKFHSVKFRIYSKFTFLLGELMQQTGLADAHVADDDVFENVRVVVRTSRVVGHVCRNCLYVSESNSEYKKERKIYLASCTTLCPIREK